MALRDNLDPTLDKRCGDVRSYRRSPLVKQHPKRGKPPARANKDAKIAVFPPAGTTSSKIRPPPWSPYLKGRKILRHFRTAEDGAITRSAAARRLGISDASLTSLIRERQVVFWTDAQGRFHLPVWEFGPSGIVDGIARCLRHLGSDYWGHMKFFLSPTKSAGGCTPLDLLRLGKVTEACRVAKETLG